MTPEIWLRLIPFIIEMAPKVIQMIEEEVQARSKAQQNSVPVDCSKKEDKEEKNDALKK